jgi:hypothetical protein
VKYSDYESVVSPLIHSLKGTGMAPALAEALSEIDDEKVGGDVMYRIAKDPSALRSCTNKAALNRYIGRVEADVLADAKKAAAPAPVIPSAAPAPHQPVGAAASASTSFDAKKESGSVAAWRLHRDKVGAGARR